MMHMRKPRRKLALIILSCIAGLAAIVPVFAYFYIHSMIGKINIVDNSSFMQNGFENNPDMTAKAADDADMQISVGSEEDAAALTGEETDITAASEDEIAELEEKIKRNISTSEIKFDKNVLNILLIGSDSRKSGGTGRSDAMILISVNKKTKTITATSILRDIYLKIPGRDKSNRINAAFAYGGADLLLDTIEQNFKIEVDKYVIIDFYAFIDLVDAVGGVSLDVTEEDIPIINGYIEEINKLTGKDIRCDCLTEAGTLLLNGKQALGYSRNRYIGSDFSRTARQREVLEQVYNKVKKLKLTSIVDLMNRILPQITTNLKEGEIFSLILSLPSYIKYDIKQGAIPAKGTYENMNIRGMAVLGIDFEKNVRLLHESIYAEESN